MQFVVMQGTQERAFAFASYASEQLNMPFTKEPIGKTDRYAL